jgi:hypothetical protein
MEITWSQFAEAAWRSEPGLEPDIVRARFEAVASQDGEGATLSDQDLAVLDGAPRSLKPALPDQTHTFFIKRTTAGALAGVNARAVKAAVQLVKDEQLALASRIRQESITTLLSYAAGQPNRLRLLDRCQLCGLVDRLAHEAPSASFRMASILAEAITTAARDPRLSAEDKERIISDTCAALLRLPARDVKFVFTRYAPNALGFLSGADREQAQRLMDRVPVSMFGERAS